MQRHFRLGGGVSPRGTLLRGQAIIEYVLIIAVVSLVVAFAGPQVSGAIRNQFSSISSALANGVSGTVQRPPAPSTPSQGSGGGSGSGSNNPDKEQKDYLDDMKTVTDKDPKDWTLEDQKKAAEDIAEKGTASAAFPKAKDAMDSGTKWTVTLNDGKTLEYKIIGINHDDLADGSGKAGLTFMTTSLTFYSRMNATSTTIGGWEQSELRQKMNGGEIWNLMPSDFQSKVKPVKKLTNNVGGGWENKNAAVTATSDKLFLPSVFEILGPQLVETKNSSWSYYSWAGQEGTQYEAFQGKVRYNVPTNGYLQIGDPWWTRSTWQRIDLFSVVALYGDVGAGVDATASQCVCPAWCF